MDPYTMAQSPDPEVRRKLLEDPRAPLAALLHLLEEYPEEVAFHPAWLLDPQLPSALKELSQAQLIALIRRLTRFPPWLLELIPTLELPQARMAAAASPTAPPSFSASSSPTEIPKSEPSLNATPPALPKCAP